MEDILSQYYPLWFSVASKYTGNFHESEELVEEAVAAYVQLHNNNIRNPKAYIARTIYHLYIDKIRRQKYDQAYRKYVSGNVAAVTYAATTIERDTEVKQMLAKMYSILSPAERAVFLLKTAFEQDYDSIENLFGFSYENCRQLMRRSREKMQRQNPASFNTGGRVNAFVDAFFKASKYGQFESLVAFLKDELNAKKKTAKLLNMVHGLQPLGLSA